MTVTVPISVDLSKEMQKHVTLTFLENELKKSIKDDLALAKVEYDDWITNDLILAGELEICNYHPHSGNYNYRTIAGIGSKTKELYQAIKIIKQ